MGYYLDRVHWGSGATATSKRVDGDGNLDGEGSGEEEERPPAVYVLPGAVVETEEMGSGVGVGGREWSGWNEGV